MSKATYKRKKLTGLFLRVRVYSDGKSMEAEQLRAHVLIPSRRQREKEHCKWQEPLETTNPAPSDTPRPKRATPPKPFLTWGLNAQIYEPMGAFLFTREGKAIKHKGFLGREEPAV